MCFANDLLNRLLLNVQFFNDHLLVGQRWPHVMNSSMPRQRHSIFFFVFFNVPSSSWCKEFSAKPLVLHLSGSLAAYKSVYTAWQPLLFSFL